MMAGASAFLQPDSASPPGPLFLCADPDEAEELYLRGFDAITRDAINPENYGRLQRRHAIVTPRARDSDGPAILRGLSCRVEAMRAGVDLEHDDLLRAPREPLYGTVDEEVLAALKPEDPDVARFKPLTVAELRQQPPRPWLVYQLFHLLALVVVWGASGSGKTFFVLDIAMAICRGLRRFGQRTRVAGVIYIAGEGHLSSRIEAYMQHHGLKDADLARFRALPTNINLLDPTADRAPLIEALKIAAKDMGGVDLVVLDTLNAMMVGGDENNSEDMGGMIAAARAIGGAIDCAVVYVHHCGKDETQGLRGHSSLRAAIDTEISVRDRGGCRSVKVEKQRDGESGLELTFRLRSVDLGASVDPEADEGERRNSCVVDEIVEGTPTTSPRPSKPPKGTTVALQALRGALSDHGGPLPATSAVPPGTKGVAGELWRQRYNAVDAIDADDESETAKGREARKKRFTRARTALLEAGLIGCINDIYWVN